MIKIDSFYNDVFIKDSRKNVRQPSTACHLSKDLHESWSVIRITNKSAIFRVMSPDVSGLVLHQWKTMYVEICGFLLMKGQARNVLRH